MSDAADAATLTDNGARPLDAGWLKARLARSGQQKAPLLGHDEAGRHQPFAMTDMQQAYWLGRDPDLPGGGTMQMYHEFDGPLLDLTRLTRAWNRLIDRHDMMRAVVTPDGRQRVLDQVSPQQIERIDLTGRTEPDQQAVLLAFRAAILAEAPPLDSWPQSRLACHVLGPDLCRLHMRLDMWCFDGRSFQIIIEDLAALYADPDGALPVTAVQFRDYVEALQRDEATPAFAASLDWWRERLATLPPPPPLPYKALPAPGSRPIFRRLAAQLDRDQTRTLKDLARHHEAGLPAVMATAYAQSLSLWSGSTRFTLNVPRFNRPDWHPDLNDIVGEFASFSLLEVDLDPSLSFAGSAQAIQKRLWTDLGHSRVSGVRQLRELARLRGEMQTGAMPVVFTTMPERRSAEAERLEQAIAAFGTLVFSLGGTPQVWLDSHYFELDGVMHFNWDTLEGLFEEGLIEAMFDHFATAVRALASDAEAWSRGAIARLPQAQAEVRASVNDRPADPVVDPLQVIHATLRQDVDRLAIDAPDRRLSRAELANAVAAVAATLAGRGIGPGDTVGLMAARGWPQVAAALGIFFSGASYMPLDSASPPARLAGIVANTRPRAILTDRPDQFGDGVPGVIDLATLDLITAAALPPPLARPDGLAALIHTSGSTGVPKAVMIPWSALSHVITVSNGHFGLTPDDRALMVTGIHHDLSLYDLLGPLAAGGGLVTLSDDRHIDPRHVLDRAGAGRATVWNSVPRLAEAMATEAEAAAIPLPPLRRFILGGDWVPQDLPWRLGRLFPDAATTTIGGPTETTIWNVMNDVPTGPAAPSGRLPYGRPIPGCSYRILDAFGRDCPDWVAGEMACGGASLALGYLNDPQATARGFITAPDTGERLYMTGDRGRFRPDGTIEILGRTDFQLNIGGTRADPAGIESVIESAPGVATVVVVARAQNGAEVLCAFVKPDANHRLDPDALRRHAAERLPPALIPRLWQQIEALPLTANGKLDRRALQQYALPAQAAQQTGSPVSTPLQRLLAGLWSDVLGHDVADSDLNFFAAGGDSIAAMRVIGRLDQALDLRLPLATFFAVPTVAGLADYVLAQRQGVAADAPIARLAATGPASALFTSPPDDAVALTPEQERLWLIERLEPGRALYNLAFATDIDGPLDKAALRAALADVIAQHDSLGAVVAEDASGRPVARRAGRLDPPLTVGQQVADADALSRIARADATQPFDLTRQLPVRLRLVPLGVDRHRLYCTFHHIAFDGWSIGIFQRDLWLAYEARVSGTAPAFAPASSFAGYAAWRRDQLEATNLAALRDWWRDRLDGVPPLEPPLDHPAPAQRTFAAGLHEFRLPAEVMRRVDDFARQSGATANLVLLTAFIAASARFSRQADAVIGVAHAGRDHAATEGMVGFFVRNLPLAVTVPEGVTFPALLATVCDAFLTGTAHLDLPFQQIVSALPGGRDPTRNPVFRTAFTYQNAPLGSVQTGALRLTGVALPPERTHLDLDLFLWPGPEGTVCQAVFATELFDAATIEGLCDAFRRFVAAAIDSPDTPIGRLGLTGTVAPIGGPAVSQADPVPLWTRIEAALATTEVAFQHVDDGASVSGPALLDRAAALDAALTGAGVADSALLALWADAGLDHLVGLLAALRRGSPVLPLDPTLPQPALHARIAAAGVAALMAGSGLQPGPTEIPAVRAELTDATDRTPAPPPRPALSSDAVLILASTSGSTGQPRHPRLTQRGLVNRLEWGASLIGPDERPRSLLKTSPAFGDSFAEALLPLLTGHTAVGASPSAIRTPSALAELIRTARPTHLVLTPSMAEAVLAADTGQGPWPLRRLHLSGEALPATLLPALRARLAPDCRILNIYGSSEVTADVTVADVTAPGSRPSLGVPLPGCAIWLLDAYGHPVPRGALGEIHVQGACLADGYHKAASAAFHDWTAPDGTSARLFRTGDLARIDGSGALQFIGRADQQLKLRGVRIDPHEIEQAILAAGDVRRAIASAPDGRQLIAHIEPGNRAETEADLAERVFPILRDRLPPSLIPTRLIIVHDWPVTSGGKILRAALPLPPLESSTELLPRTGLEGRIAALWSAHVPAGFGMTLSFFEAGGDSLRLAELHRKLEAETGRSFPLVDLFRHPTVRAQAQYLGGGSQQPGAASKARERAQKRRSARVPS